ncbi:chaperone protein dnaJ 20, chloroplastic-like [Euphorbia lathyris]|uniref:chaperone protein dnaJ 20, chloroplastic-like n=1 Tax=Euphorbia lathyris TaxID=212925 RepID=UPI003313EB50
MASAAISSSASTNYTKLNLSTPKSCLQLSSQSQISFNSNFSKSSFPLKKTLPKSAPIKAVLSDAVYVNTQSYYELLGISESDSIQEIKKAYRQLARKYHPDVSPAEKKEEHTKMFLQVQEAYETLSDPKSRACYDRDMASGLGLHANFTARSRRCEPGMGDMNNWEQRWQSQLSDLIRKSNSKDLENSTTWGARMRRERTNYSN